MSRLTKCRLIEDFKIQFTHRPFVCPGLAVDRQPLAAGQVRAAHSRGCDCILHGVILWDRNFLVNKVLAKAEKLHNTPHLQVP